MVGKIVLLLFILMPFLYVRPTYALGEGLMFYLPFDGTVTEKTKGLAGEGENYTFVNGKVGQGAYFPNNSFVHYAAKNNINYRQGTVEFWVQPNWNGDDGGYHYFFAGNIDDARNVNSIHVSKKYYQDGVILGQIDSKAETEGHDKGRARTEASVPANGAFYPSLVTDWRKGAWHHLAFTWDDKKPELKLYIDGFLRATNSNTKQLNLAFPSAYMSYINIGSSIDHATFADAVIDELKIWDHPLGDMEVAKIAGLVPLEQTIAATGSALKKPDPNTSVRTILGVLIFIGAALFIWRIGRHSLPPRRDRD